MTAISIRSGSLPVVAADCGGDAAAWAGEHRAELRGLVDEHGAVLVRGLDLQDATMMAGVSAAVATRLMVEREGFAPRDSFPGGVYSGSQWPSNQPMCMHHEVSYALEFPSLLVFACLTAPAEGGATAVADSRAVLDALPPGVIDRLETEGWSLTRNYGDLVGLPWPATFGTDSRDEVERYCADNGIEVEWSGDNLRTRQRRRALIDHPVSGQRSWFNQIAFLSEWTLDPDVRDYLSSVLGADGLSFNSAWGDGEPFAPELIQQINSAYERATLREPWRAGDLMLVDNVRMAHSREPYRGDRTVLVAMGDPVRLTGGSDKPIPAGP